MSVRLWILLSVSLGVLSSGPAQAQTQQLESFSLDAPSRAERLSDCLAGEADKCDGAVRLTPRSLKPATLPEGLSARGAVNGWKPRLLIKDRTEETAPPVLVSVDVDIFFETNSDQPLPSSAPDLADLAVAIRDARFDNKRFAVLGHTDARGSAAYNMDLSVRRAREVMRRLQDLSGLPAGRFVSDGRGESELRDPANPQSGVNRRVQIILFES